MVFENINVLGLSFGYIFLIVIAGASLILAYYKKKGLIKFQSPITKEEKEKEEGGKDES